MPTPSPSSFGLKDLRYIVPILLAVWMLDNVISKDRYGGWERNSVRNSERRWDPAKRAKVAIMGSSTSKDWLDERTLGAALGYKRRDVVDAHINGCHQGCTWAEVRRLLQRGRKYEKVFYGTNLFQICEQEHSKRVLQQSMMTPAADIPRLFGIYAHSNNPLRMMGRFGGMQLSGAFGDTGSLRADLAKSLGIKRGKPSWRWARAKKPSGQKEVLSCEYSPASVRLKRAFSEALYDDLKTLSKHTYLMLLPDRTRSIDSPEHKERWKRHMALHQELAAERPWVTLIDLVTDGADKRQHFRDGFHLNRRGMAIQKALFDRHLEALGLKKKAKANKPKKVKR